MQECQQHRIASWHMQVWLVQSKVPYGDIQIRPSFAQLAFAKRCCEYNHRKDQRLKRTNVQPTGKHVNKKNY